jgi:hypothetical protein
MWEKKEGREWAARKKRWVRLDVNRKELVLVEKGALTITDSSMTAENDHEEFMVKAFLEFARKSRDEK